MVPSVLWKHPRSRGPFRVWLRRYPGDVHRHVLSLSLDVLSLPEMEFRGPFPKPNLSRTTDGGRCRLGTLNVRGGRTGGHVQRRPLTSPREFDMTRSVTTSPSRMGRWSRSSSWGKRTVRGQPRRTQDVRIPVERLYSGVDHRYPCLSFSSDPNCCH